MTKAPNFQSTLCPTLWFDRRAEAKVMIGLYYSGGEDKMSYSVFRDYRISMLRKFITTMLVGMICLRVGAEDVVCRKCHRI